MGIKDIIKGKKKEEKEIVEESSRQLSPAFKEFIEEYKRIAEYEQSEVISPIHVDELASKIAVLYEKIRRIIDWKEEHLIRRVAIERILRRTMISQLSGISLTSALKAENLAEPLVLELIRNGYFPNDRISSNKIVLVQNALSKYIYILQNSSPTRKVVSLNIKSKVQFYTWILSIAACEIEEILDPPSFQLALINFMTYRIFERIHIIPPGRLSDSEKFYQTYIAVHRALFHLDPPIIIYHLIRCRYPQWTQNPELFLKDFTKNITQIWRDFERELLHPKSGHFYGICERYDTVYLVIGDILKKMKKKPASIEESFSKFSNLKKLIEQVYNKRLSTLKKRLYRAAIYSTLSIFLAGGVSLFIIEVPIAKLFYGEFSPGAILVDIFLPTAFMFLLVSMIRLPSKKNFQRVIVEAKKIVYYSPAIDKYEIVLNKRQRFFKNLIFGSIFALFGTISLGFMFWIFYLARIPWTSIYIDTINIAVIVFAALIIRQRAKEMTVVEDSIFFEFFLDMISIPLAKIGQWFAMKWQEYNFVSVFFSALVDAPFASIIKILEDWRSYLRDMKSGLR